MCEWNKVAIEQTSGTDDWWGSSNVRSKEQISEAGSWKDVARQLHSDKNCHCILTKKYCVVKSQFQNIWCTLRHRQIIHLRFKSQPVSANFQHFSYLFAVDVEGAINEISNVMIHWGRCMSLGCCSIPTFVLRSEITTFLRLLEWSACLTAHPSVSSTVGGLCDGHNILLEWSQGCTPQHYLQNFQFYNLTPNIDKVVAKNVYQTSLLWLCPLDLTLFI